MNAIIETDRMLLRRFVDSDFQAVYEFNSNKEVQKYTGDVLIQSIDQAKEIIAEIWFKDYNKYGYGRYAAVHKSTNKVIGFAGLKYLPEIDETDIGFRYLPEYWGKGIATEVGIAVLKYGFETIQLDKIIGIAMPENTGSRKVLEKLGLEFYKIDAYEGDNGKHRWYQLTREKYMEKNGQQI